MVRIATWIPIPTWAADRGAVSRQGRNTKKDDHDHDHDATRLENYKKYGHSIYTLTRMIKHVSLHSTTPNLSQSCESVLSSTFTYL